MVVGSQNSYGSFVFSIPPFLVFVGPHSWELKKKNEENTPKQRVWGPPGPARRESRGGEWTEGGGGKIKRGDSRLLGKTKNPKAASPVQITLLCLTEGVH